MSNLSKLIRMEVYFRRGNDKILQYNLKNDVFIEPFSRHEYITLIHVG